MRLQAKFTRHFAKQSVYMATIIRFLLDILLLIIVVALAAGVFKSGHELIKNIHEPLEVILQRILVDIVFIVALVEISLTILGYLKEGRVHVRYIVDTILIIMLNEIVTLWFTKPSLPLAGGLSLIILTLALVRVSTVRFAPNDRDPSQPNQFDT